MPEGTVPFGIILIQALEDVKKGKNISKAFDSVDEMFEELDK